VRDDGCFGRLFLHHAQDGLNPSRDVLDLGDAAVPPAGRFPTIVLSRPVATITFGCTPSSSPLSSLHRMCLNQGQRPQSEVRGVPAEEVLLPVRQASSGVIGGAPNRRVNGIAPSGSKYRSGPASPFSSNLRMRGRWKLASVRGNRPPQPATLFGCAAQTAATKINSPAGFMEAAEASGRPQGIKYFPVGAVGCGRPSLLASMQAARRATPHSPAASSLCGSRPKSPRSLGAEEPEYGARRGPAAMKAALMVEPTSRLPFSGTPVTDEGPGVGRAQREKLVARLPAGRLRFLLPNEAFRPLRTSGNWPAIQWVFLPRRSGSRTASPQFGGDAIFAPPSPEEPTSTDREACIHRPWLPAQPCRYRETPSMPTCLASTRGGRSRNNPVRARRPRPTLSANPSHPARAAGPWLTSPDDSLREDRRRYRA